MDGSLFEVERKEIQYTSMGEEGLIKGTFYQGCDR